MSIRSLVLAGALAVAVGGPVAAADRAALVQESRAAIMALAETLKGELMAAIQAGDPVGAIAICNERAAELADQVSTDRGLTVGRTSDRSRSPDNRPDAFEAEVLRRFAARAAAGEPLATMDHAAWVATRNGQEFRYMKAIPAQELCLTCHGSEIAPEVKARLDALYPSDRATGYGPGELRGAFTVRRPW